MIRDFRTFDGDPELECDLCIAGAGAAGIALARAFKGRKNKVLVLESGGFDEEEAVQSLYRGASVGQPYFDLDVTRLRQFGGSTNHWGGQSTILDRRDFTRRAWIEGSGWPIERPDLEPYYGSAHGVLDLGTDTYDPDVLGAEAPGLLSLTQSLLGHRVFRFSDPPTAVGAKYRSELERAANIEVLLHANLVDIDLKPETGTVRGFAIRSLTGRHATVRARAFVLALGGIENARLLLSSDRAMPGGIGNQHDQVGRYFMDHLGVELGAMLANRDGWEHAYRRHMHESSGAEISYWMAPGDALMADAQIGNFAVMFGQLVSVRPKSPGYTALRDIKDAVLSGEIPDEIGSNLWDIITDLDGVVNGIREKVDSTIHVTAEVEQTPNPESRVQLAVERDALGMRRVELDWRLAEIDRRTAKAAAESVAREFGRLGVGRLQLAEWLRADDRSWSDDLHGSNHHIGTTRMADHPRRGVVDRHCRVFGCNNLFVAGSSIFTTSGFANPTVTIVALALRLADHLELWLEQEGPAVLRAQAL